MAFAVLQCARKALLPRLLGSVGERALSNSDSEEELMDSCVEDGGESEEEATDVGPMQDKDLSEETGESKAVQALQKLRYLMTLAVRTVPHLPSVNKSAFVLLLLTISTQELIFYGVYSTPHVEVQRQKTMDFILEQGQQALTQLCVDGGSSNARRRGKRMLRFLEQARTPPAESSRQELFVEATISACRISQCNGALQKLQPWTEGSARIPKEVSERVLKVLSYTRATGKRRLKADVAANSWVEAMQRQVGFAGIFEARYELKSFMYHMPFEEEMGKIALRYGKLARALAHQIKLALRHQPLEHNVQETPHQREQRENQGLQPLNQQHHSTSQLSEHIAALSSVVEPAERPVTVDSGVVVLSSSPIGPISAASQGSLPTRTPPLLNPPLLQSTRLAFRESSQHIITPCRECREEPPLGYAPGNQQNQQENRDPHQPSSQYVQVKAVFSTEAPVFAPTEHQHAEEQRRTSPISSVIRDIWGPGTSPTGSASPWQSAYAPTGDVWQPAAPSFGFVPPWKPALPLARPPTMPAQHQSEYLEAAHPISATAAEIRTPLHTQPRFHQLVPGPSVASPRPRQPTERPSLGLHRPTFQSPTSKIQHRVSSAYGQYSGGQGKSPGMRFEAPAAFWPPESGSAQGSLHGDSWRETRELNPVLDLIAEAFPAAESHWSDRARLTRQGGEVWSRVTLSHLLPLSGDNLEVLVESESNIPVPKGSQEASPASEGTLQETAWSLRDDGGDGSKG
ncbi:hypothetical protein EBH_0035440 [Eimeria brunetti]|uniref:Uncharacterized protein n=1 Tax=Eimeria brunetti TaxID=51314 RepID=U6LQ22_9EIME|nr:hypothetical protein EBH_0035440 [Eimeria brunetti]